jgi:hypothetical protein
VPRNLHKALSKYDPNEKLLLGRLLEIDVDPSDRSLVSAGRLSGEMEFRYPIFFCLLMFDHSLSGKDITVHWEPNYIMPLEAQGVSFLNTIGKKKNFESGEIFLARHCFGPL